MPLVTVALLGGQDCRGLPGPSLVLPAVETPCHAHNIGITELSERFSGEHTTNTTRAVDHDRCATIGHPPGQLHLEVPPRNMYCPLEGALLVLVRLADVERHGTRLLQHFGCLSWGDFSYPGTGLVQQFTKTSHTKQNPTRLVGIPIPAGRAIEAYPAGHALDHLALDHLFCPRPPGLDNLRPILGCPRAVLDGLARSSARPLICTTLELDAVVARRRMCRSFLERPVDPEALERALALATRAPSAGNTQGWAFVILEGDETAAFWQHEAESSWLAHPSHPGLLNAPVIVLPLASRQSYVDRYSEADKATVGPGASANGRYLIGSWTAPSPPCCCC